MKDINTLGNAVRNIHFSYYSRLANKLADNIAKRAQACTPQNVYFAINLSYLVIVCYKEKYHLSTYSA